MWTVDPAGDRSFGYYDLWTGEPRERAASLGAREVLVPGELPELTRVFDAIADAASREHAVRLMVRSEYDGDLARWFHTDGEHWARLGDGCSDTYELVDGAELLVAVQTDGERVFWSRLAPASPSP